jgi:hypothetical protein
LSHPERTRIGGIQNEAGFLEILNETIGMRRGECLCNWRTKDRGRFCCTGKKIQEFPGDPVTGLLKVKRIFGLSQRDWLPELKGESEYK